MGTSEPAGGPGQAWKIGTLAKSTGLTVRALHHYHRIGLLSPSWRTSTGHRLYTADDVARLCRIRLLRGLGFPLEQIAAALQDPQWQLAGAVSRHLQHTQRRAAIAARLRTRLASMAAELEQHDSPSLEQLFPALEEMTMLDGTIHSTTGMLVYDDPAAAQEYLVRVYGLAAGPSNATPAGGLFTARSGQATRSSGFTRPVRNISHHALLAACPA